MADPKIRFKRSSVQGKQPTVDQLPLGEAALNTYDGRLYVSKSTDSGVTTSIVNLSGFNLQDEGVLVGYANTVNFVGGTVSVGVSTATGIATVTVSNGGVGIQSAGTLIGTGFTTLNFIGAGNTFAVNGTTVDISIQGGGGTGGGDIGVQANGSFIGVAQTTLNFIGTGVTAVSIGKTTNITIEPGLVGAAKSAYSFTATAGQTTFSVNYSQGQENVFRNGVRLSENGDYTATNGSQIVLTNPANAGDQIDVVVYLRGSDPQRNINVSLAPSFNGVTTAFTMYSAGLVFDPLDERQIIVSVGGVIQQPGVAYTVGAGASIYFSSAPSIGATCFITALYSYSAQRTSVNVDGGYGNLTSLNVSGLTTTTTLHVGTAGTVITTSGIGSVGIGTTIPRYRLDVNGDINFNGTFYQGGSQFVASRWTAGSGDDIYRLSGDVGIGTTNPLSKLSIDSVYGLDTTTTSIASTALTTIDSFAAATFRSARVQVQITQGTNYQASDVLLIHDGSTTSIVEYAAIATNDYLGTLSGALSGGNALLQLTMTSATASTVRVVSQKIRV